MLTVHQLSKSYSVSPLFHDVTFTVNRGERVGLIGPNGSGKSTLLRLIAGEESADSGHVAIATGVRIGYLAQGFAPDPAFTFKEIIARAAGDPGLLEREIQHLALAIAEAPEDAQLQGAYDHALRRLTTTDPGRVALVLNALGLEDVPENHPVGRLSGGQKTRLSLALLLLEEPHLLLLDEPTNHLDIDMLVWLEAWLCDFSGAVLLVSHDRTFLDRTVNKIVALDPHTQTAREYTGNFSDYIAQVQHEYERQMGAYRDQRAEIRRMRQDITRIKQQAKGTEQSTKNDQLRRYAKKVARKATSREKKLQRYIDDEQRVEKPARSWQMKLDFQEPRHVGQDVLVMEELAVGFPGQDPLLSQLNLVVQGGSRIVLTGANGSGKTTLLRTIAGQLPPLSGVLRLGSGVQLGYMTQEQTLLDPQRSALQLIQRAAPWDETQARSFLHYFLFSDDDPLRPSVELSFGERARLTLALLVARGSSFLLLDEPLNHLDIPSRSRFEEALAGFEGTVLAVVHDRAFIDKYASEIWRIRDGRVVRLLR